MYLQHRGLTGVRLFSLAATSLGLVAVAKQHVGNFQTVGRNLEAMLKDQKLPLIQDESRYAAA